MFWLHEPLGKICYTNFVSVLFYAVGIFVILLGDGTRCIMWLNNKVGTILFLKQNFAHNIMFKAH